MSTFEQLKSVFVRTMEGKSDLSAFDENANLFDDLGMNSISLLYMALATEEEFGISFTNEDLNSLKTVRDVINCIETRI